MTTVKIELELTLAELGKIDEMLNHTDHGDCYDGDSPSETLEQVREKWSAEVKRLRETMFPKKPA